MSVLLLAGWIAAGVTLILPLGLLVRLGRRLMRRAPAPQTAASAAAGFGPEETAVALYAGDASAAQSGKAVPVPAKDTARRVGRALKRSAPVLNLLLYIAFVAGAIYYVPHILSWALDTPHPMAAVSSQSMWPALKKDDLIFLEGVDGVEDLQVGDIIAFEHPKGITVHRIIQIEGETITTKGDANPVKDRPIDFSQVVGRVLTLRGHIARVPYVGSLPGIFGSLATQPSQTEDDARLATGQSSGATAAAPEDPSQAGASPGTIEIATVDSTGNEANGPSTYPAISGDGRLVAFVSAASNLVPGDANRESDVFVHDILTGITERVSVDSAGHEAGSGSEVPVISGDGRFVAFVSGASNLVSGDTNGQNDVFVHDRQTRVTERVSVDSSGKEANGSSGAPTISADGRFVAFVSTAGNLVHDDSNGQSDVFVRDRQTGITERISVDSRGGQGDGRSGAPSISGDGRFVAFLSEAPNLVRDDTNGQNDIFVHDRQTGVTERVSVDSAGREASGPSEAATISADGRFVAFVSAATDLLPSDTNGQSDVFVHDRQTGTTELASVNSLGNQASSGGDAPAISADGRFVAFQAGASNLVSRDNNRFQDVFVHDRQTGATQQVSVNSAGDQGNDHSGRPAISADGRFVAFWSWATNLASVEVKQQIVVVHDRDGVAMANDLPRRTG